MPIYDPFSPENTERRAREDAEQLAGIDFPVGETILIGVTEATGLLTVGQRFSADSEPFLWFLTPCCGGAAKGVEDGIVCKGCYQLVSPDYGDIYDLHWHGPINRNLTDADRAIFARGRTPRERN